MVKPIEYLWDIEPHTEAKHEILERYFDASFPILATYNQRIICLNGFCGPGRYRGGEPGHGYPGSVHQSQSPVFLQAVGWRAQETSGKNS